MIGWKLAQWVWHLNLFSKARVKLMTIAQHFTSLFNALDTNKILLKQCENTRYQFNEIKWLYYTHWLAAQMSTHAWKRPFNYIINLKWYILAAMMHICLNCLDMHQKQTMYYSYTQKYNLSFVTLIYTFSLHARFFCERMFYLTVYQRSVVLWTSFWKLLCLVLYFKWKSFVLIDHILSEICLFCFSVLFFKYLS